MPDHRRIAPENATDLLRNGLGRNLQTGTKVVDAAGSPFAEDQVDPAAVIIDMQIIPHG